FSLTRPSMRDCEIARWRVKENPVLSRKQRATPAVARIFDGEKEAKLIALACSKPPKGRARWTLRLLENKVVELRIVDRASDSTIGRTLKETLSSRGATTQSILRPAPTEATSISQTRPTVKATRTVARRS